MYLLLGRYRQTTLVVEGSGSKSMTALEIVNVTSRTVKQFGMPIPSTFLEPDGHRVCAKVIILKDAP
jgi:hypothetical protein